MANKRVFQTDLEVGVLGTNKGQVSQVFLDAYIEDTAAELRISHLFVEVAYVEYEGFFLGEINVPYPTEIEYAVGSSLREFDKVSNLREITSRPGTYFIYKFKWSLVKVQEYLLFEAAREAEYMPVRIWDSDSLFDFSGFITDYKNVMVHDVPPLYEVSMTVESDI